MKIEKLQELIIESRQALIKYEQEIRDIYEFINLSEILDLKISNDFIDKFYDRFATDQILAEDLTDSEGYIEDIIKSIEGNQKLFKTDIEELDKKMDNLRKEKIDLYSAILNIGS